jgi:integrase
MIPGQKGTSVSLDATTTTLSHKAAPARKHVHGLGNVYLRGRIWWIVYHDRGAKLRESSKSPTRRVAEDLLKKRLGELGRGAFVNPTAEVRITVNDLLDALVLDYHNRRNRTAREIEGRIVPLRTGFGRVRAIDVTADRLERYKADRSALGKAPATINRELAALRRAFRIAVSRRRIQTMPTFELLPERNARQGFLEPATFAALARELPSHLQDFARFGYLSGWRKGEIQTLAWSAVDRAAGVVTLRAEHSKNGEPRTLPMAGELAALIDRRWSARVVERHGTTTVCPFVFHHDGEPIGDFRKAWAAAAKRAGIAGILFHDLRRSAVRNLDRAGVSQSVAMSITGHKTISVYHRYRIVRVDDQRRALEQAQQASAVCQRNVVALGGRHEVQEA